MSTPKTLPVFVAELRALGVRTYKGEFNGGTLELELGPPVDPESPQTAKDSVSDPIPRCHCGCAPWDHQNGLCLSGCEVALCAGPEATA